VAIDDDTSVQDEVDELESDDISAAGLAEQSTGLGDIVADVLADLSTHVDIAEDVIAVYNDQAEEAKDTLETIVETQEEVAEENASTESQSEETVEQEPDEVDVAV
jgi:hypothetical protein